MSGAIAIILAAGLGSRLAPLTDIQPKGLLPMDGQPLLAHSIARLRLGGVRQIRLVIGHLQDAMAARFGAEPGVQLCHNPDFARTGSLQSLLVGLEGLSPEVASRVLVLESDLIYEARAIRHLMSGDSKILTSGFTGAGDEVYVWADTGGLVALSKDRMHMPIPPLGELTGLNAIQGADLTALRACLQAQQDADPRAHYEDGFVAAAKKIRLTCDLVEDLAWAEIDDASMLARAKAEVWPEITRRDRAIGL